MNENKIENQSGMPTEEEWEQIKMTINRCAYFFDQASVEGGIVDAQSLIEKCPHLPMGYQILALIKYWKKEFKEGDKHIEAARQFYPKDSNVLLRLRKEFEGLGCPRLAYTYLAISSMGNPDSPELYKELYQTAYNLNRLDACERWISQYIRLLPNDFNGYFYRSRVYFFMNKFEEAVNDSTKFIQYLEDNGQWNKIEFRRSYETAYSLRAGAYQKLNRLEESDADFKKYEELNPEPQGSWDPTRGWSFTTEQFL